MSFAILCTPFISIPTFSFSFSFSFFFFFPFPFLFTSPFSVLITFSILLSLSCSRSTSLLLSFPISASPLFSNFNLLLLRCLSLSFSLPFSPPFSLLLSVLLLLRDVCCTSSECWLVDDRIINFFFLPSSI